MSRSGGGARVHRYLPTQPFHWHALAVRLVFPCDLSQLFRMASAKGTTMVCVANHNYVFFIWFVFFFRWPNQLTLNHITAMSCSALSYCLFVFCLFLVEHVNFICSGPVSWLDLLRGRHKVKSLAFRTLLNMFVPMFSRACQTDWSMFFWEKLRIPLACNIVKQNNYWLLTIVFAQIQFIVHDSISMIYVCNR